MEIRNENKQILVLLLNSGHALVVFLPLNQEEKKKKKRKRIEEVNNRYK